MATQIRLIYFAQLRELAARAEEIYHTEAETLGAVYDILKDRYNFPFTQNQLRVVVNENFVSWDDPVEEGAVIVFIPPVTGG